MTWQRRELMLDIMAKVIGYGVSACLIALLLSVAIHFFT